jgi:GWxTD domain-containing protein
MNRRFALVLVLTLTSGLPASAQNRVRYEQLAATHRDPVWHARTVALAVGYDSSHVLTSFRLAYEAIPFRRLPGTDSLQATIDITVDYLEAPERASRGRRSSDESLVSLKRLVWTRTVTVSASDAKRAGLSLADMLETHLPTHRFRTLMRVEVDGAVRPPAPVETVVASKVVLIPVRPDGTPAHLGSNTRFGEPTSFRVIAAPDARPASFRLFAVDEASRDSTIVEGGAYADGILTPARPDLNNRTYRIVVCDSSGNQLGDMRFLPRWYDMPIGLLNLDLAIDLMRFSISPEELRAMRRGSQTQREDRFRAWWAERDPTPDSPYNELMAEYFKRIHEAFVRFSTPAKAGYESDMGATWIRYGEPLTVERRMPPGGSALEVWDYGNRRYIFRATTGFGDFELLSSP